MHPALLALLVSFASLAGASDRRLNLYLLDFDNLRSDAAVEWLAAGLPDMLRQRFTDIDGVHVYGRPDFQRVLGDRTILFRQPVGTQSAVVMGTFSRELDKVTVRVQAVNVSNWNEIGAVAVTGSVNQVAQLQADLAREVAKLLETFLPAPLPSPEVAAEFHLPLDVHGGAAREIGGSMVRALDDLERSLDRIVAGAPPDAAVQEQGKFVKEITLGGTDFPNAGEEGSDLLEKVLTRISDNPYEVEIGNPRLEYDADEKETIRAIVPVTYTLKEALVKDLLYSLPYSAVRQDGSLTTIEFSRRDLRVAPGLNDRINRGAFRMVPVIQLLDRVGRARLVILDTSEPSWFRGASRDRLVTSRKFSPLIAFTLSGWSLQVSMETVAVHAEYEVTIKKEEVGDYARVVVEFVPEDHLESYLGRIL